MRLIIVALLGIEITILALASAASAATHPEGSSAQSGLYEAMPGGWDDGLARSAVATVLDDTYGVASGLAGTPWAYERLVEAHRRLAAMRDWPVLGPGWQPAAERTQPLAVEGTRAVPQAPEDRVRAPKSRETATKAVKRPVHTGVVKMPKARRHVAHKRAQVDLTRALPRKASMQMSHATAAGWLRSAGLRTKSTGGCVSKHLRHCTSLDSVRLGTIARVIELKRESGCPIMVTGGTERGHAPGHFSHGNGYKLDISHNACIDRHITKHHDKAGVRSDGATIYKSGTGTTFFDESDHWDILFR
ncbi:hypothetical protein [Nonomuraea candida]|uniref:hypothetical protein n=1 Tax=Nonomuraea candida TaxID=359159 RepID=UPI0006948037|nr:hypothetical protein [Nonomuraea candida]